MEPIASLKYFIPELFLLGLILVVIVTDLIVKRSKAERSGYVALGGSLILLVILLGSIPDIHSLFGGTIVTDPFGHYFKILATAALFFTIWASLHTKSLKEYNRSEFWSLLMIAVLGIYLLASAIDLIVIYLSFEMLSLMSYALTAYLLKDSKSNEAALKYVIYGAFSSGMMLFGMTWLYGLTGTLRIDEINLFWQNGAFEGSYLALIIALILMLVGMGYKTAAVPFHFWSPDVYEGAPTPFTGFLSVAPKAAGFAILIRILNTVFSGAGSLNAEVWPIITQTNWTMIIAIISVATMTLGNFVALQQENLKRMLAYSSIAHAGYMLMGLVVVSNSGLFAILYYLAIYLLMNLGAFFMAIVIHNATGRDNISDFAGFGYRAPLLGVLMTIFMFSLTGLPPTAGFIGKFYLFAALIQSGNQWYWLAVVAILNSVVSLWYYVGVVIKMYSTTQEYDQAPIKTCASMTTLLVILAIPTLLLGLYWMPLQNLVRTSLRFFLPI